MRVVIDNKEISEHSPVYIIAEIGVNHNGSIVQAKHLIDAAIVAGADAVKFQMFRTERLVIDNAPLADYQLNDTYNNQKEMLKSLELSKDDFVELKKYCDHSPITFISTPFDEISAIELNDLDVPVFKIGSGDLTNFPLLTQVNHFKKPIILSTGMSTIQEIKATLHILGNNPHVILMHCTSAYPAHFHDLHLNAIRTFKMMFNTVVGYSDHSLGMEVPIAATALGYKVIEKHFTLDKSADGPDHKTSLTPTEFTHMVQSIRNVERALGSTIKKATASEKEMKKIVRRGIYAKSDLSQGHELTVNDLNYLRPLSEIEACHYEKVIGRTLRISKNKGQAFQWCDFNEG